MTEELTSIFLIKNKVVRKMDKENEEIQGG